ncbi:MAG: VCBS repeat-containing protein, partial [Verrucomicrobia bacterium]|nr:VCBS repeat-containing protein [Verrucomicrobiota bacterium]
MKRGVRIGILPLEIFQSLEKASSNLPIIGKNVTGFSNVWKILLVLLIAAPAFGQMATVTNTIPHNGSNAVEQTANIVAQFDQSMRGSTITSNTFFLYSSQRGMNRGAITFNTATNRAALNPSRDLLPGDFVNATLTRSITNAAGTVGLRHHTWTFVGAVTNLVGFFDQIGSDRSMTDCIDVALGDVDNDGDLDAVIVGFNGSPTRVYTNKGDGVLSDSGQTLSHANGRAVALGDLDRDGDLDVVVANSGGPSRLWTNNGSGLFFQNGQSLTTNSAKDVALGDFDGDGWLDAIFADGQTTVWTNNRTGKLYETARHIADSSYGLVAVGDVNGDG